MIEKCLEKAAQDNKMTVEEIKKKPQGKKRKIHDDITIIVVDLKGQGKWFVNNISKLYYTFINYGEQKDRNYQWPQNAQACLKKISPWKTQKSLINYVPVR